MKGSAKDIKIKKMIAEKNILITCSEDQYKFAVIEGKWIHHVYSTGNWFLIENGRKKCLLEISLAPQWYIYNFHSDVHILQILKQYLSAY